MGDRLANPIRRWFIFDSINIIYQIHDLKLNLDRQMSSKRHGLHMSNFLYSYFFIRKTSSPTIFGWVEF